MTWTMPTAPTPLVASPALVSLDSLVMELTAQVSSSSAHVCSSCHCGEIPSNLFSDIDECGLGIELNPRSIEQIGGRISKCNVAVSAHRAKRS